MWIYSLTHEEEDERVTQLYCGDRMQEVRYRYSDDDSVVGSSSSSWTPQSPVAGESVNFWAKGRNGLTMPDSVGANDVSILTPTFRGDPVNYNTSLTTSGGTLERLFDGGSYTVYFKVKQLADAGNGNFFNLGNSLANTTRGMCLYNIGGTVYQTFADGTNYYQGNPVTNINVTLRNAEWVEVFVNIDFANKLVTSKMFKCSDGSSFGVDISYSIASWIFNNNDNAVPLIIKNTVFAYADIKKFSALKTIAQCRDNAYVTDLQFYYPEVLSGTDVSGNAHHMTRSTGTSVYVITEANSHYSNISTYCMDYGYSLYRSPWHARWPAQSGYMDIYVPNTPDGISINRILTDIAGTTYEKIEDHIGNLTKHNLAESLLTIPFWDKSNVTIFKDSLRALLYYDVSNPTRWHPSELNLDILLSYVNIGYEGMFFMKVEDTSAYDRKFLTELFCFTTNKIGNDFKKAIQYTNDVDWYHTIDYYFSDISIRAQRENKVLAFDFTTKILSLSLDGGVSYPITKDLTGVLSVDGGQVSPINDAYIFANGNITFADNHKEYLSTDNLSTYHETTVLDINGNPYVSINTWTDFKPLTTTYFSYLNDGTEIRVWGNYQYDTQEVNIWFTKDSGVTIKSIYRRLGATYRYTHTHAVSWDYDHQSAWVQLGESANSTVVKAVYKSIANTWAFSEVGTGEAYYRIDGMAFYGSKVIYNGDSTTIPHQTYGLWQIDYSDLGDFSKRERANYIGNYDVDNNLGLLGEPDGQLICGAMMEKSIRTSINRGKYFRKFILNGGPDVNGPSNAYYNFLPKNTNKYYRADIFAAPEEIGNGWNWEKGPVLMVRILKVNEIATPL